MRYARLAQQRDLEIAQARTISDAVSTCKLIRSLAKRIYNESVKCRGERIDTLSEDLLPNPSDSGAHFRNLGLRNEPLALLQALAVSDRAIGLVTLSQ